LIVLSRTNAATCDEGGRLDRRLSAFGRSKKTSMNNPNNHMNKNRQRGRNGGGGGKNHSQRPPGRNPNFGGGGGGGEQRPRGNAQQLMEKYLQLARDSTMQGDRVLAENYFQHADHYYRVLNARFEQNGQPQRNGQGQNNDRQGNYNQGYNQGNYNGDNQGNYNGDQGYGNEQPRPMEQRPQQNEAPAPVYQQQPQPQPAAPVDEDIGLPPAVLGNEAPAMAEPAPELETVGAGGEESRPNPGGRGRRRGGRADRTTGNTGE